jgi:hypothetical protein
LLNLGQELLGLWQVLFGDKVDGTVLTFVKGPPENTGKGGIQVDDPPGHVSDNNRIRGGFQHGSVPLLALFQSLLRLLARGDIPVDHIDGRIVIFRGDRFGQDGDIHQGSVFSHSPGIHLNACATHYP